MTPKPEEIAEKARRLHMALAGEVSVSERIVVIGYALRGYGESEYQRGKADALLARDPNDGELRKRLAAAEKENALYDPAAIAAYGDMRCRAAEARATAAEGALADCAKEREEARGALGALVEEVTFLSPDACAECGAPPWDAEHCRLCKRMRVVLSVLKNNATLARAEGVGGAVTCHICGISEDAPGDKYCSGGHPRPTHKEGT